MKLRNPFPLAVGEPLVRDEQRAADLIEQAARATLSGRASAVAKHADGNVEALRVLLIAKGGWKDDGSEGSLTASASS